MLHSHSISKNELLEAGTTAKMWALIDEARRQGLIYGGPYVPIDRCHAIIQKCSDSGIILPDMDSSEMTQRIQETLNSWEPQTLSELDHRSTTQLH